MNSVVSKLTSKGQLTLPKSVRDQLKLAKGSYIAIYLEKDQIVMKKVNPKRPLGDDDPIWDMAGMFHGRRKNESESASREVRVAHIQESARWKPSL